MNRSPLMTFADAAGKTFFSITSVMTSQSQVCQQTLPVSLFFNQSHSSYMSKGKTKLC
jgi:hypothetical protein